jgi:hypothetical protein
MDALFHEPFHVLTQPFEIEIRAITPGKGRDDGRIDTLEHIL